ncbi:MAG: flagellin, partial [Pseudobutyrivibrio sp.]|nr:flagellin [Pseudobutyrivibrio sp.]
YMYLNLNGFEHDGADYFLDKIRSIKQVDVFSNSGADNEGSDTAGSADKGTISFSLNRIDVPTSSIDITEPELTGYEDINKNIHSGPDADMAVKLGINYKCLSNFTIGLDKIDVLTEKSSMEAMGLIDEAAKFVVAQRSVFGAYQNRLEHTVKNLGNVVENTQSAESRIRDTDMASEMVNISKGRILAQAGEAMLSQANTSTEGVMSLLQ